VERLAILGAGGHAREVFFLAQEISRAGPGLEVVAFMVPSAVSGAKLLGCPLVSDSDAGQLGDISFVTGMGQPALKRRAVEMIHESLPDARFATLVHPNTVAATDPVYGEQAVKVDPGAVVTAGNIMTVNIRLGSHAHLNLDCTVGHDTVIEEFVTISPGVHISGNVCVEAGAFIGTGANLVEGVRIGRDAVVGAGACVIRDVDPGTTVVGVPAAPIRR
jgi:sugar O-acyltransferase (sialic acid O-acetyltransferase NeuD family)